MHWNWSHLCGRGEDTFRVWSHSDFGHCFELLVFTCSTHGLFAVMGAYFAGQRRHGVLRTQFFPRYWSLHLRLLCSVCLVLLPLLLALLTKLYLDVELSLINIAALCVQCLSWLVHVGFVVRLHRDYTQTLRGPAPLVFCYFLTFASQCIMLHTVIHQTIRHSKYLNEVEKYITFVSFGINLIYIVSLVPSKRAVPSLRENHTIQDAESEEESLLGHSARITYGSFPMNHEVSLGRAEDHANCLSHLFFCWVNPLMLKGHKGKLSRASDLFHLPESLDTAKVEERFKSVIAKNTQVAANGVSQLPNDQQMDGEVGFRNSSHKPLTLVGALNTTFGWQFYPLGVLKLLSDLLGFCGPILLNLLVSFMENSMEPMRHGYLYAGGLLLSTLLTALLLTHFTYLIQKVTLRIRASLITTVYRKTMSVNSVELSKFSSGQVVNFMSTDTDRVTNFCMSFHQFWSLPFQVAVSLYLLHQQVGLAFLAGLTFAVLLIPVNRWIAIKIGSLSTEMMQQKDARVKLMNEILHGIRVVKFYSWEQHFSEKVKVFREAELKSLKGRKYLDAMCVYFWATTPVLISILTFTTYALMGNQLTAAKVFTSLALFNILISPLNAYPWVINGLMEAWVSVKRINTFLQLCDLNWSSYYAQKPGREHLVSISNGNFTWRTDATFREDAETGDEDRPPLLQNGDPEHSRGTQNVTNINLHVKKGCFVGVIGKVGSGKSSLLNAILAEMQKQSGRVSLCPTTLSAGVGLVAQEAWIQHATVRDNILFGKPYNRTFYEATIHACALSEDLKVLAAGDQTEIGENGVTLSGGQKARVALARSVYQDKDVYFLDDPLAAVDAHVATHLYKRCIRGLLRQKTVILCTHHTKYLQDSDLVVLMDHGTIAQAGPPVEVLNRTDFDSVLERSDQGEERDGEQAEGNGELVQEEEKHTGVVKLEVYKAYWFAVGACLSPLVLFSLFLMQASRNVNDWWLSYWVTHSHARHHNTTFFLQSIQDMWSTHHTAGAMVAVSNTTPWTNMTSSEDNVPFYLTMYGILAGANSLFTLARAFLFAYGGICAAQTMHEYLLSSILKAPVRFFDVTPIGRIINRFSSDLYTIDDSLPFIMNILLAQFYGVIGSIAITVYGLPWFAIVLVPLTVVYYFIQNYYRQTSREVKRITSVTLSPIYAHFAESLNGIVTIRAHREIARFIGENRNRLEDNQRAQFVGLVAGQWLGIRLQMMGVAMVTAVAFIGVLEHHFHTVNPGLVGLAISYALSITNLLSGVVQSFTETEKQMVSVERAGQYINDVPAEKESSTLNVPPFWPIQGAIYFHRVSLRYRPNLPLALNNVTFETHPHEKIGIVGRTGSGKSSLFLALFRMVEIEIGNILIDGINLSHLDLSELRGRLAIIPQDPFLFSGTVRENLDPQGFHQDQGLWEVLSQCHLRGAVEAQGGLEAEVAEKGKHFSVGQRQLLCLARALLTKAKVLCLDEATASVDQETDHLIQQTIRRYFRNNTVLTVAHRVDTVLDSDRVLVMQAGEIAEFAPPQELLQNPQSLLYALIHGSQR